MEDAQAGGRHERSAAGGSAAGDRLLRAVARRLRYRSAIQISMDGAAWAMALGLATLLRYDFHIAPYDYGGLLVLVPVAVAVQTVAGFASGLYTGRSRFGSFDEVVSMVRATVLTTPGIP